MRVCRAPDAAVDVRRPRGHCDCRDEHADGEDEQTHVAVKTKTKLTTFLHDSELKEEKVLGEESFGIVDKGTFRGNDVAMVTELATCESLKTASK